MTLPGGVRAVLVDIEGTTTPTSFVYDVLFPFAAARLEAACAKASQAPDIADAIDLLRSEHQNEAEDGELPAFGDGLAYARFLMEHDRKSTGLKTLQGHIWLDGYRSGELRGQVYDDVPTALRRWNTQGLSLRVFSSGSVLAQKLLFGHTEHGDLTGWFDGFHDTTTGPKFETVSYRKIAGAFGRPTEEVLFLSDVVAELDAASGAGMRTGLLARPGNAPVLNPSHAVYSSFRELHG